MLLVGVIIPCYNTGRYLAEAINSVVAQTFSDYEIVIVDDGSTDNTREVAESYTDHRIRYTYQDNKGLAGARNTGICCTRGEYIAFLDADDLFLPRKLLIQVSYLEEHSDVGLVAGGFQRIDHEGRILYNGKIGAGVIPLEDILVRSVFPVHCSLVRRSWVDRVGGFDKSLPAAEDWDFYCRLALGGCLMHAIPDVVAAYRMLPKAMSMRAPEQTAALLRVVDKTFRSPMLPPELRPLQVRALAQTHLTGAGRHYAAGLFHEGHSNLLEAVRLYPEFANDHGAAVSRTLLFWSKHANLPSAVDFVRSVFSSMPTSLEGLFYLRSTLLYQACAQDFRAALRQQEWWKAVKLAVYIFRCHPVSVIKGMIRRLAGCVKPKENLNSQ